MSTVKSFCNETEPCERLRQAEERLQTLEERIQEMENTAETLKSEINAVPTDPVELD